MLKGKRILAVIPARGGSKGVPLKNIHPLGGRPLLAYAGDIVREAGYFDRAIVSTDHPGIAEVARPLGLEVPFYRPESLSGDRIGDYDVLLHALTEMERLDKTQYDVVVMLQPTCPLRTAAQVNDAVSRLIDGGWSAVWTVSRTDLKYHPLKQLKLAPSGELSLYDPKGRVIIARQQLDPVYYRNGAAYAFTRDCLLREKTILPDHASAIVLDTPMISIDTLEDFATIERLLEPKKA